MNEQQKTLDAIIEEVLYQTKLVTESLELGYGESGFKKNLQGLKGKVNALKRFSSQYRRIRPVDESGDSKSQPTEPKKVMVMGEDGEAKEATPEDIEKLKAEGVVIPPRTRRSDDDDDFFNGGEDVI